MQKVGILRAPFSRKPPLFNFGNFIIRAYNHKFRRFGSCVYIQHPRLIRGFWSFKLNFISFDGIEFIICTIYMYTGCNRRNGPDFGRVFLRSNYTDITQNTYIQSLTVTEILAREKSGLLWCLRTVLVGDVILPLLELNSYVIVRCSASDLDNGASSKSV